jgi:hypothetical protein
LNIRNQMVIKFTSDAQKTNIKKWIISSVFCLCFHFSFSQFYAGSLLQSPQLVFDCKIQPSKSIKDSAGYSYSSQEYGFNAIIPVFSKKYAFDDPVNQKRIGVFLTPILRVNNTAISYLYDSRILINTGLGIGAYYSFKQKHTVTGFLMPQVNEDEFSISDPVIRYSGALVYAHKSSNTFSYFLGVTYTYLLGGVDNSYTFPVIGARFKTGERSNLNIMLPFTVNYSARFNKWKVIASLKPNGGINRYTNRSGFSGDASEIILHKRSFVLGTGAYYHLSANFSMGAELGIIFGRKLAFTNENKSVTYIENTIANGGQLTVKAIWRPWQNTLRNKKKQPTEAPDNTIGENDLFIF